MLKIIKILWNSEQISALNLYQKRRLMHPYTCGFNRTDENHLDGEGVFSSNREWLDLSFL